MSAVLHETQPVAPPRLATLVEANLAQNAMRLLEESPSQSPIAIDLRANAYGHGAERCLRALSAGLPQDALASLVALRSPGEADATDDDRASGARIPVTTSAAGHHLIGPELLGLRDRDDLAPVMRLDAEIMLIKQVGPGEAVSYGRTYPVHEPTRLGVLAIGFTHGVPRAISNKGWVLVNGYRCRIAGKVSMDQMVVDLGQAPASPGDRGLLLGDPSRGEPSIHEWVEFAGTAPEIITSRLPWSFDRAQTGAAA